MDFIIKIINIYIYVKARANFFLRLNAFILLINSRLIFNSIFNFFYLYSKLLSFYY